MVNKIYKFILVLLFALPVAAQTPKIAAIGDVVEVPGTINVPVYLHNFEGVEAITLKIQYDTDLLTFIGLADQSIEGEWPQPEPVGGELVIGYNNTTGNTYDIDGLLLNLVFDYNGFTSPGFSTPLTFLPGCEISVSDGFAIPGIRYIDGSVTLDSSAIEGITWLGSVEDVSVGTNRLMPLYMEGSGYTDVAAFSFSIRFDSESLTFISAELNEEVISGGTFLAEPGLPGVLEIGWYGDATDLSELSHILDIRFLYHGVGPSEVYFLPMSEVGDIEGNTVVTEYRPGFFYPVWPDDISLTISTEEAFAGQAVSLSLDAAGFTGRDLGAVTIRVGYDIEQLYYAGFSLTQGNLVDDAGLEVEEIGEGHVVIAGYNLEGFEFLDGEVLKLNFLYLGGGDAPVVFRARTEISDPVADPIDVALINGGVIQPAIGDDTGVALIGKVFTLVDACETLNIQVPVSLTNVETGVGALTMKIRHNGSSLTFTGLEFPAGQEALQAAVGNNFDYTSTQINVAAMVTGDQGLDLDGVLFYLNFRYNGGTTPLEFIAGSALGDINGDQIDVVFVNGLVTPDIEGVELISSVDQVKSVTGTPVILPFTVSYPDFTGMNGDIMVDARITAAAGFPDGAEVLAVHYNGVHVPVINGDLNGSVVYLSEILGHSGMPLAPHSLLTDEWAVTVAGIEEPVDGLHILIESIAFKGVCVETLADVSMNIWFDHAVVTLTPPDPDQVCYDEVLSFSVAITYPEILNVDESILANTRVEVSPALTAGSLIEWSYNGQAGEAYTLTEDLDVFYLSDVVGFVGPLQGLSGTDLWSFDISGVVAGDYQMQIIPVAQIMHAAEDFPFAGIDPVLISFTFFPDPVVSLDDIEVCEDAEPFALYGGTPEGGEYSGPGVEDGIFDPAVTGVGSFEITYTYTDENDCTSFAVAFVHVHALPEVSCPEDMEVLENEEPFLLTGATPEGGTYSGPGVEDGMFDPAVAGVGVHEITYSFTNENGCTAHCTFEITVQPAIFELILLVSPEATGQVEGAGMYTVGDEVSITATANDGYMFVNWTDEDGAVVSGLAGYTFVMPGNDLTLTANFMPEIIITEFPWCDDFEEGLDNWAVYNVDGAGTQWVISTAQNHTPGGEFSASHPYAPASAGYQDGWMISPRLVLPDDTMMLTFWSYNGFPTWYEKNSVLVSSGSNTPGHEDFVEVWTTESVTSAWVQTTVDLSSFSGQEIYIAFRYEGLDAHTWFVDDVCVEFMQDLYTVNFIVTEDSPEAMPIEGAAIAVNGYGTVLTGADGTASMQIGDGSYTAVVSKDGYITTEVPFVIDGQGIGVEVSMLDVIVPPFNLAVNVDDHGPGNALFTWNHSKIFVGFNVYFEGEMVAEEISPMEFLFTDLANGTYTAGVQSVYTTGISEIVTIDFTITSAPPVFWDVTFYVNMTYAEGFDIETDNVYITGSFLDWAAPGSDPANQLMTLTDEYKTFTISTNLEQGTYEYKYFMNTGWDGGEWAGGANRTFNLNQNLVIYNWFGYMTDPTDVTDPTAVDIRVFPVPARTQLTVESNSQILEIRMIDMLGQIVYSAPVNDLRHGIDVYGMRQGVYFVQVLTNEGIHVHRVQVTR